MDCQLADDGEQDMIQHHVNLLSGLSDDSGLGLLTSQGTLRAVQDSEIISSTGTESSFPCATAGLR